MLSIQSNQYPTPQFCAMAQYWGFLWSKQQYQAIGIITTRTALSYLAVAAAFDAGVRYVPIEPDLPLARIQQILAQAQVDVVYVDADAEYDADTITALDIQYVRLSDLMPPREWQAPRPFNLEQRLAQLGDQVCCVLFTSGSTGQPKGVPLTAANCLAFLRAMLERYAFSANDRIAQFARLSFDMSLFELLLAWHCDADLIVVPDSERLAPAQFIQREKITVWYSVPAVISYCARLKLLAPNAFPSLRYSGFAGESLQPQQAAAWQQAAPQSRLENLYGPTETNVCLAHHYQPQDNDKASVPIGMPVGQMHVDIIDQQQQFLGPNQTGQLVVAGAQVIGQYWQSTAENQQAFCQLMHPEYGLQRWYLTGDKVYKDHRGQFYFLGRYDLQVKLSGHRVELAEVEAHLRALYGVSEVAALCYQPQENRAAELVAFVVDSVHSAADYQHELRQRLPFYMVPRRVVLLTELPLTPNGKCDRVALLRYLT